MTPNEMNKPGNRPLPEGMWRGIIAIQGKQLPFQLEVSYPQGDSLPRIEFINGAERVAVGDIEINGRDIALRMPVFNTRLDVSMENGHLAGTLTKVTGGGSEQRMPVTLHAGESHRFFARQEAAAVDVSGRWAVRFVEADGSSMPAVGEFVQVGNRVTGTFLTPTSDHRYLAGEVRGSRLYLSAWDGYHVFLFEADIEDDVMQGEFWSGAMSHETWTAQRNADAELPDMDRQTVLRQGVERLDFTFPDPDGVPLSLSDARFRDKVVIVQLGASWCPNSADATRFLVPWYRDNRERGIEVVALMFEHFEEFGKAAAQVRTWQQFHGVEYPALVAGTSDKREASRRLPQLDAFKAFPTTLFIGRDGRVARIQTGFNGPATSRHETDTGNFKSTVETLLQEGR